MSDEDVVTADDVARAERAARDREMSRPEPRAGDPVAAHSNAAIKRMADEARADYAAGMLFGMPFEAENPDHVWALVSVMKAEIDDKARRISMLRMFREAGR